MKRGTIIYHNNYLSYKAVHRQGRQLAELVERVDALTQSIEEIKSRLRAAPFTAAPITRLDDCPDCHHSLEAHTGELGECDALDCDCELAPAEAYLNPQDDPRR